MIYPINVTTIIYDASHNIYMLFKDGKNYELKSSTIALLCRIPFGKDNVYLLSLYKCHPFCLFFPIILNITMMLTPSTMQPPLKEFLDIVFCP